MKHPFEFASPRSLGLMAAALLAACSSNGPASLPAAAPGQPMAPSVALRAPIQDPAFMLRDERGRPIPHTHIMPSREAAATFAPYLVAHAGSLRYHGGLIQRVPAIYVVFWGFQNGGDPDGEAPRLTSFLRAVGASPWLGTVTQYYQSGSVHITNPAAQFKGFWYDTTTPIPAHPTDAQVAAEAILLAEHYGVYSDSASYIVATPHDHNIAGFPNRSGCAYHSDTTSHGVGIPYTNFPYMSDAGQACGAFSLNGGALGRLDGVSIVGGHELAETQTDPGPSGGWWDAGGNEIGDKCSWFNLKNSNFGSFGTFPTQPLWSNAATGCVQ